jgi:hypothetical protein
MSGLLICVAVSLARVLYSKRSNILIENSKIKQAYEKGKNEGFQYALERMIENKILAVPDKVDGAEFVDCIFVKYEQPSALLCLGSNCTVTGSTFLAEGRGSDTRWLDATLSKKWGEITEVGPESDLDTKVKMSVKVPEGEKMEAGLIETGK